MFGGRFREGPSGWGGSASHCPGVSSSPPRSLSSSGRCCFKLRQSGTDLFLRDSEDREVSISLSQIDEQTNGTSLMPTGLFDQLTESEFRDPGSARVPVAGNLQQSRRAAPPCEVPHRHSRYGLKPTDLGASILRTSLEVLQPGKAKLVIEQTVGLSFWIDQTAYDLATAPMIDWAVEVQKITTAMWLGTLLYHYESKPRWRRGH